MRTLICFGTISSKTFYISAISAYACVCLWLYWAMSWGIQTSIIVCPMKLLYRIPCPGCGTTRATVEFLHGHFIEAILLNPNVILAVGFLFLCPLLLAHDALTKHATTYDLFNRADSALKIKWVFAVFCVFELFVIIHNIVNHI